MSGKRKGPRDPVSGHVVRYASGDSGARLAAELNALRAAAVSQRRPPGRRRQVKDEPPQLTYRPLNDSEARQAVMPLEDDLLLWLIHQGHEVAADLYRALRRERATRRMATQRALAAPADVHRAWAAGGLYAARRARGMTIAQLAAAAGIDPVQLTRAERHGGGLGLANLLHVMTALGLDKEARCLQPALFPSRPRALADGRADRASYQRRQTRRAAQAHTTLAGQPGRGVTFP
jgi:transcriptional regulator with XRE-family HTH domain